MTLGGIALQDRVLARWIVVLAATVFILSIGTPLIGIRVFHGADMVLDRTPWRRTPPGDVRATNPIVQDTVSTFLPLHAEVRRRLWRGEIPLWTPFPGGGLPLATVPDEGTFGPLNIPYRLLPLWYAPGMAKLLELASAMGFTFLFLRRLALSRPTALMGGLIYAMSGFQVAWTNWPQSHVGALVPAVFWAVERGLQERTARAMIPISLAAAALVFEGFVSLAGYAAVAVTAYGLVRLVLMDGIRLWKRLRLGVLLGLMGLLGVGLTTFQLLPLADRVAHLDLRYREQRPGSHLPLATAATLAIPNAFGSPVNRTYFGPANYVEIQGFVGASTLVLVAAAAAWPLRGHRPRGSRGFLWGTATASIVLLYVGGPVLGLFQLSPLFRLNFVTRLRPLLGLTAAALAAVGMQAVLERSRGADGSRGRAICAWAAAVFIGALGLAGLWRVARQHGQVDFVTAQSILPLAAAACAAAAVTMAVRPRGRTGFFAVWTIPVIFGVEAIAFAGPFWPRIPREDFYPVTTAHEALGGDLGRDRLVGAGGAMYPGTTTYYGLRSLTTNNTLPGLPTWEDLVRGVDPAAFERSSVFPGVAPRYDIATSPILDRLAVRYFVTPPTTPVFGPRTPVIPRAPGRVTMAGGDLAVGTLPLDTVRAVVVRALAADGLGSGSRLIARIQDAEGDMAGQGYQLVYPTSVPGPIQVPVVERECTVNGCHGPQEMLLRFEGPGSLVLQAGRGGPLALDAVAGVEDGLRVRIVDNVVGYQRRDALHRIRWAGSARVVEDAETRLTILKDGLPPDEVLLSRSGPLGSGDGAHLQVAEDSGDRIRIIVDAQGDGYVVVADPLQQGWIAALDGRSVVLRAADHGVVAVHVPAGKHEVLLVARPPGWRPGLWIASGSALILLSLAVLATLRARVPSRSVPS